MSTKEKILHLVGAAADDVTIDTVIYRLELLKSIEEGLEEADRGEGMEHDAFFTRLLDDEEKKNPHSLDAEGAKRSGRHQKPHRARGAKNRR